MAQRTVGTLLCIAPLRQVKKEQAIPARAGGFAGDRAQRAVMPRLVLKSIREHFNDDLPITDAAREQRTGRRQPPVLWRSRAIDAPEAGIWPGEKLLGRSHTKISIIGDLGGSAACPFAQISVGIGLQAPGNAAKQEPFVRGFRLFAEQLAVSLLELGDLQFLQCFERRNDGWVHGWVTFLLLLTTPPCTLCLAGKSSAKRAFRKQLTR